MGKISEFIHNLGSKSKEQRVLINQMTEQLRMEKIANDRMKPNSQRMIERYEEEQNEKFRKVYLEKLEKNRENDFNYGHNPLNAKMVVGKTEWEVLRERNMFKNNKSDIFNNHSSVLKGNKNLLKNNKRCY